MCLSIRARGVENNMIGEKCIYVTMYHQTIKSVRIFLVINWRVVSYQKKRRRKPTQEPLSPTFNYAKTIFNDNQLY